MLNPTAKSTDSSAQERRADTSVSTATVDSEGVVRWTYRKGAVVRIDEAKEEVDVIGSLVDRVLGTSDSGNPLGNKVPLLIDIRPVKSVSRDARALLGSDQVSDRWCVSGLALIINSRISQMIGNATLYWQRTKHPLRLFTDVEKAHEWLLRQPAIRSENTDSGRGA